MSITNEPKPTQSVMADLTFILTTIAFFGLMLLFTIICEKV